MVSDACKVILILHCHGTTAFFRLPHLSCCVKFSPCSDSLSCLSHLWPQHSRIDTHSYCCCLCFSCRPYSACRSLPLACWLGCLPAALWPACAFCTTRTRVCAVAYKHFLSRLRGCGTTCIHSVFVCIPFPFIVLRCSSAACLILALLPLCCVCLAFVCWLFESTKYLNGIPPSPQPHDFDRVVAIVFPRTAYVHVFARVCVCASAMTCVSWCVGLLFLGDHFAPQVPGSPTARIHVCSFVRLCVGMTVMYSTHCPWDPAAGRACAPASPRQFTLPHSHDFVMSSLCIICRVVRMPCTRTRICLLLLCSCVPLLLLRLVLVCNGTQRHSDTTCDHR